jgi:hypothetical protein
VRRLIPCCAFLLSCVQPEPVQDPLEYLRVGVDPASEADVIIEALGRHGFQIGRRVKHTDFVAFDAVRGLDSTVRVVTLRGPSFAIQVPDARWPERLRVELDDHPPPDFNRDGRPDVVVAIHEHERTCLAWAEVDARGFVDEVFRANADWGRSPCVIEIDPAWPRLLLEVSVPDSPVPNARVRLPIKASARSWVLDESPSASARWQSERQQREEALESAESRDDSDTAERLRVELGWLEQLRKAEEPVLEPASDGEEAR